MDGINYDNNIEEKNENISKLYKIFKDIYSKAPFVLKDLSHRSVDTEFKKFLSDKIDFKKINNKFCEKKYASVTDALKDIRLVFLNCYKFYGHQHRYTKKSLKIEEILEKSISLLDNNLKVLADVQLTLNLLNIEKNTSFVFKYPKNCYDSVLLKSVAHYQSQYNSNLSNLLIKDGDNAVCSLKDIKEWENEFNFNHHCQYISSMWELPEIGNFVTIIFKEFHYDIVHQGEIERMFLMPKQSTAMSKIMTTILMPYKKIKMGEQFMTYSVWSAKLCKEVSKWYKVYHTNQQNKVNVMNSLGIHPDFWTAVGDTNPLVHHDYCDLSYFVKVWLVKGLCDNAINFKVVNNIITNCNERQCTIWMNDAKTEEYFFFNSMPDLRIYYYNIPFDEPSLEFLETEILNVEVKEKNAASIFGIPSVSLSKLPVAPNEKYFKLIADSVEGLRSFLDKHDTGDSSVPKSLIAALKKFIIEVEPKENNLIVLNNESKIKLYKDWKSYPKRKLMDKDITKWETKKRQSIIPANDESPVLEKRKRNAVIKQEYDYDFKQQLMDSDEYFSESDKFSITDSEDEWGAINQPTKSKSLIKTPSKLLELENRLKNEEKMSNPSKMNGTLFKRNSCTKNKLNNFNLKENNGTILIEGNGKLISESITSNNSDVFMNKQKLHVSINKIRNINNNSNTTTIPQKSLVKIENSLNNDNSYIKISNAQKLNSNRNFSSKGLLNSFTGSKNKMISTNQFIKNVTPLVHTPCKLVKIENGIKETNIASLQAYNTLMFENYNISKRKLVRENIKNNKVVSIDINDDDDIIKPNFRKNQKLPVDINRTNYLNNNSYKATVPQKLPEKFKESCVVNNSYTKLCTQIPKTLKFISNQFHNSEGPINSFTDSKNKSDSMNQSINNVTLLNHTPFKLVKEKNGIKESDMTNSQVYNTIKIKNNYISERKLVKSNIKSNKVISIETDSDDDFGIKPDFRKKQNLPVNINNTFNINNNSNRTTVPQKCPVKIERSHSSNNNKSYNKIPEAQELISNRYVNSTSSVNDFNDSKSKLVSMNQSKTVAKLPFQTSCKLIKVENGLKKNNMANAHASKFENNTTTQRKLIKSDKKNNDIIYLDTDSDDDGCIQPVIRKNQKLPIYINKTHCINNNNFNIISTPQNPSVVIEGSCIINNNWNKLYSSVSTSLPKRLKASYVIPKLNPEISIMPANINLPKCIQVTVLPQTTTHSHLNSPRCSSFNYCDSTQAVENVKCKIVTKNICNGEVEFYAILPNGELSFISGVQMNRYLKDHKVLPDYWMIPLPKK